LDETIKLIMINEKEFINTILPIIKKYFKKINHNYFIPFTKDLYVIAVGIRPAFLFEYASIIQENNLVNFLREIKGSTISAVIDFVDLNGHLFFINGPIFF